MRRRTCFAILPLYPPFDDYYHKIIAPAAESAGFISLRPSDLYLEKGALASELWRTIVQSEVCLADTSDQNPIVMYALGVAHALHKPVVLFSQQEHTTLRVLSGFRHVIYDRSRTDWDKAVRMVIENILMGLVSTERSSIQLSFSDSVEEKSEGVPGQDEFIQVVAPEAAYQCMKRTYDKVSAYCRDASTDLVLGRIELIADMILQEYGSDPFDALTPLSVSESKMSRAIREKVEETIKTVLRELREKIAMEPESDLIGLLKSAVDGMEP